MLRSTAIPTLTNQRSGSADVLPLLVSWLIAAILLSACARTPEQKYSQFMKNGKAQVEKHDYSRAILEFKNAIQVKPKSDEAYYQLSLAYLAASDIPMGIKTLQKTLELNPKNAAAQVTMAELAVQVGNQPNLEDAEKRLRQLLADSPGTADAFNVLAIAEWKLGRHDEAEKLLKETAERFPHDLKAAVNLATIKLSQKDVAGADAILRKLSDTNPTVDAAIILGQFYVATAKPADAEKQFERALQLDAKNGEALAYLAGLKWRGQHLDEADALYKRAAALPDPRYKPIHAIFLYSTGKRDLAIAEFEKLFNDNPSDREARARLIAAYRDANRPADAARVLSKALQKEGKDVDALLLRSDLYLKEGKYSEAESDLATVLHFKPDLADAHYLMAKVYERKGQGLRYRQELGEALRLKPALLTARLEFAAWLIAHGTADTALQTLDAAPPSQKDDISLLLKRNWALLAVNNRTEARAGIDRALQNGSPAEALVQDGVLKLSAQEYGGARKSAQQALDKEPDSVRALELLVRSYELEKQTSAAVQAVRDYAARRPKSAAVQMFYGRLLMRTGNRQEARVALNAANSADPQNKPADLSLADLDISDGKIDDARAKLTNLVAKDRNDIAARLLLAAAEERAGNHPGAIGHYRKALEIDDTNIHALNDLAYLLAEYGNQADEALTFAQKAGEISPENLSVQDTLGWVLYRKGMYDAAIQHLEQAVAKEPTGMRKAHLAVVYLKAGNERKGMNAWAEALTMDPNLARSELFQEFSTMKSARAR